MLPLTKSKCHKSNSPYSGFPNYLQTKPNLHISFLQSQTHLSNPDGRPCILFFAFCLEKNSVSKNSFYVFSTNTRLAWFRNSTIRTIRGSPGKFTQRQNSSYRLLNLLITILRVLCKMWILPKYVVETMNISSLWLRMKFWEIFSRT